MSNLVTNYTTTIVTIYQQVIQTYENNLAIIKQTEEELNDLVHEAEFAAPKDMYKGYLIYKDIRDLRQKRRCAKNTNELLKEMYDFLNDQQGQSFKTKIQQIQGHSAKINNTQESRVYQPRQRTDLTIGAQTGKDFEDMMKEFNKNKPYMKNGKMRK
jgi:hypothetical protein